MIEVVAVTPGGEVSLTCVYADLGALSSTIDRLTDLTSSTTVVEWYTRPARGYRWA